MTNVLITGANRGIGLELVRQCLSRGDRVWGSCRDIRKAKELCSLRDDSENLSIFALDVCDQQSVENAFSGMKSNGIKIDLLFNNAGIIDWNEFSTVSAKSFDEIYKVNVTGAFLVTKYALELLHNSEPNKSKIINLSSRLGSIKLRGSTQLGGAIAYQCSKAALNMLTRQTAIELSGKSISVISMSPGWVKTDMGGPDAKYEPNESVSMMLHTLENLKGDETGVFIGEDGIEIPW
ncbi:MAG: SDR family oxidoreductase [Opitutales bacterium]|nr:SDR family oxidoreductase [Opitutales bacterium]